MNDVAVACSSVFKIFDYNFVCHYIDIVHINVNRVCGLTCLYSLLQQDCPNGRLTPAKFVDMYKMFFPSGNAEEFCDHVFRTFDMDKNGYIDFKVCVFLM